MSFVNLFYGIVNLFYGILLFVLLYFRLYPIAAGLVFFILLNCVDITNAYLRHYQQVNHKDK